LWLGGKFVGNFEKLKKGQFFNHYQKEMSSKGFSLQ